VFDAIEKQSEFYFFYNRDYFNDERIVSVDFEDKLVEVVLKELFKNEAIKYEIYDRNILLTIPEAPLTTAQREVMQQQRTVSGNVTDESGQPLPGVTVVVKGTTQGTVTNADGEYSLTSIPEDATLVFSFVGMSTQEVAVGDQTTINIVMEQETIGIEEVVAIGYGTVKKSDLTGSVATVQGDLVSSRQNTQVSQALQGAMPGVMVTRNNNAPGSSAAIRIRGVTTIGDSNPLIIVDGVPVGSINDVNPNDVEDISVLKDAASAAIYGARAAAGVILVTTKRAELGERSLTYSYKFGIEKPTEMVQFTGVTRYMEMANEQRWNDAGNDANEYPTFPQDMVDNYHTLNAQNPDLYPITDWNDVIFDKYAPRESHELNFTTGTENISSHASFSYETVDGLHTNRNYTRITARVNNDLTINDYLKGSVDFYFRNAKNKRPTEAYQSTFQYTRSQPPIYAADWSDGRIAAGRNGYNPLGNLLYGGFFNDWTNQVGGKISIDFEPFKGFTFSSVFSPNLNFYKRKVFNKQVPYYAWDDPTVFEGYIVGQERTSLNEMRNDNYNITTQFLANYETSIGVHNLNILAGNENYYAFYENLGASRDEYILTSFPYLDLGPLEFRGNTGNAYENAYQSLFGRVLYNYSNKYFLQANIRFDASSRFHSDYRWGSFPSFSAGWVISEEPFMENVSELSFLKLRASWGALGNERIGNYPYQATMVFSNALFYRGDEIVSAQGAAQSDYAIRDISWEKTESANLGIDAYFFDNHLRLSGDYFVKTTKDMLLVLDIPDFTGFDDPDQNTGEMDTKGWELEVGWQDKIGELGFSVSANVSDFKSVMGDLGGTEFIGAQINKEGSEFNEWYGYLSDWLFQTQEEVDNSPVTSSAVRPGDVKYIDISGTDGEPDGNITPEYDRVLLGGSLPRYMYGGNIQLFYKNFDFLMVIQGVGKQNARLDQEMARPLRSNNTPVQSFIDGNYWSMYNTSEQNQNVKYPRLSEVTSDNNYAMSDFWLIDGSYLRLKNITLGYNVPVQYTSLLNIQDVRLYASVADLHSFDNFPKGWDPEASYRNHPITASFIFGILVKF
jgi:TonB-linked SusC/RagA family outer membrane protein